MGSKFKEGKKEAPKAEAAAQTPKKRKFEFPSNVRQIGGLNKGIKIYIEDYAYTYILKLGAKKEKKETAAFLVGFLTSELGEDILVISGAISPPMTAPPQDGHVFSDADKRYASSIIEKHFKGLEIVGWARQQPGYGLYLSAADISGHYLGFTDKNSVLFLSDPEEKLNCFFTWNENQDDLTEASGYFIYYDKNHEMSAYISELRRKKKQPYEIADIDDGEEIKFSELVESMENTADNDELEAVEVIREEEMRDDEEALSYSVDKAKRIADIQRQKRIISMMTSVSGLLFFACVIMVIGLLQSGDRISNVESQMKELRTGYNSIVARVNNQTAPAFAAQNENRPQASAAAEPVVSKDYAIEPVSREDSYTNQELENALGIAAESSVKAENQAYAANSQLETVINQDAEKAAMTESKETNEKVSQKTVYIVQQGDTLTFISNKFYGTTTNIGAIMDANGLSNPNSLRAGEKLIIP